MTFRAGEGDSRPIIFIDFEASGLGARSWPVEVGWAAVDGACETFLVKPVDDWPQSAWEPTAEALHGLSFSMLQRDGVAPAAICKTMNAALCDAAVYSDAPDWDAFWLYRLFSAARVKPAFELLNFAALMAPLAPEKIIAAVAQADIVAPRRHRARDDALHLRAVYALAFGLADDLPQPIIDP